TGQRTDLAAIRTQRQSQLEKMSKALAVLREFHATGTSPVKEANMDVRQLIERIIVLRQELTDLSPGEEEMLPSYQEWMASTGVVNGLMEVLEDAGWEPVFASHPSSRIREELFLLENPYQTLSTLLEQALRLLDEIGDVVRDMGIPPVHAA